MRVVRFDAAGRQPSPHCDHAPRVAPTTRTDAPNDERAAYQQMCEALSRPRRDPHVR